MWQVLLLASILFCTENEVNTGNHCSHRNHSLRSKRFCGVWEQRTVFLVFCPCGKWGESSIFVLQFFAPNLTETLAMQATGIRAQSKCWWWVWKKSLSFL